MLLLCRAVRRERDSHQMHERGSIDVMRLNQTLCQSRHVGLHVKLYFDENLF
jgi:hypothetical protein